MDNGGGGGGLISSLFSLLVLAVWLAGLWKMMVKAGQPGWVAIVPFYNIIMILRLAGRPWWWLLLAPIPVVGIIVVLIAHIDLAKAFGKGIPFAVGLTFIPFVFFPILAFGDAVYTPPPGSPGAIG